MNDLKNTFNNLGKIAAMIFYIWFMVAIISDYGTIQESAFVMDINMIWQLGLVGGAFFYGVYYMIKDLGNLIGDLLTDKFQRRINKGEIKMPEMIIYKDFEFDFAHFLPDYIGPCSALHGHRGKIRIYIKGPVDPETGMVIDFVVLKKLVKDKIISKLDHTLLNDTINNPTSENIIKWAFDKLCLDFTDDCSLHRIDFWETPSSCCIFGPEEIEEYELELCNR